MRVKVPTRLQLENFSSYASEDSGTDALEVELEDADCDLHPVIVCMLSALHAGHSETRITVGGVQRQPSDIPYFAKMGALNPIRDYSDGLADLPTSEGAGSFIRVSQMTTTKHIQDFALEVVPLLHASLEQSNALKYVLWELLRNVTEHSGSDQGAFAAAEVGSDGVIKVGVADLGIGVLKSIRRSHPAGDEQRAIALALAPGVSGATPNYGGNEQNGGAGLFVMKAIASLAREHMVVVTGDQVMTLLPQSGHAPIVNSQLSDDSVEWTQLSIPFPGTAVGVNFTMADSKEFANLLAEISAIYRDNVRGAKRAAKKARFT